MMIQFYNNSFLDGKTQVPLDPLCLTFALLNLISLLTELFFAQALSDDTNLSLIDRRKVGI